MYDLDIKSQPSLKIVQVASKTMSLGQSLGTFLRDFMFIFDFFPALLKHVSMSTGTSESALLFMSKYTFPVQIR